MKALVTGGAGFIGSHLAAGLAAAGNEVRGCEVVFHQAALPSVPRSVQDPLTSNAANVIGTLNVLLAARDSNVRRVVKPLPSGTSTFSVRAKTLTLSTPR